MPYIKDDDDGHPEGSLRKRRRPKWIVAEDAGELNFAISCLLVDYMMCHGLSYPRMDDCTGACGDAAAEFRRRVMDPYEDQKIEENGDIGYELLLGRSNERVEQPCDMCGAVVSQTGHYSDCSYIK